MAVDVKVIGEGKHGRGREPMISAIRRRLTWANVAMTVALVFAMTGGAYAAKKYLITSTSQISPKVLKELAGKPGKQGLVGPQGPAGANGKDGAPGAVGEKGANGKDGAPGVSPVGTSFGTSAHGCKAGGVEYKGATTNYVCNGAEGEEGHEGSKGATGATGPEGSPWTLGGTLPSGKTVYGHFAASGFAVKAVAGGLGFASTGVSFPLPVSTGYNTTYIKEKEPTPEPQCKGTASSPEAPQPGNLCIFVEEESNVASLSGGSPLVSVEADGFTIFAKNQEIEEGGKEVPVEGPMYVFGHWALTAR